MPPLLVISVPLSPLVWCRSRPRRSVINSSVVSYFCRRRTGSPVSPVFIIPARSRRIIGNNQYISRRYSIQNGNNWWMDAGSKWRTRGLQLHWNSGTFPAQSPEEASWLVLVIALVLVGHRPMDEVRQVKICLRQKVFNVGSTKQSHRWNHNENCANLIVYSYWSLAEALKANENTRLLERFIGE